MTSARYFRVLILFSLSFASPASPAASPECFPATAFQSYDALREVSQKHCLQSWVDVRTAETRRYLDAPALRAAIGAREIALRPVNPPSRLDLGDSEIYLAGGKLMLAKPGHPDEVLIETHAFQISPDAKKVLFARRLGGADVSDWRVYDLERRQVLPDAPIRIRWGHLKWDSRGLGIFYTRWPTQAVEERWNDTGARREVPLAYHRLGTSSSDDEIIFENREKVPSMIHMAIDGVPGQSLLVYRQFGSGVPTSMYWGERKGGRYDWMTIQEANDPLKSGSLIGRARNEAIFKTAECGSNYCLIAIELVPPFKRRVLIPYTRGWVLNSAQLIGPYLHVHYFDRKFRAVYRTFTQGGKLLKEFRPRELGLPDEGTLSEMTGTRQSTKAYLTFSSMSVAPVTLVYDLRTLRVSKLSSTRAHPFDGRDLVRTEVRSYRSFDGTRVPVHVYTRRDAKSPPKFAFLFYYGALGATYLPSFTPRLLLALELGGMVAVANVRGGGEKGYDWYRAGSEDKMTTIRDLAWASRWLKRSYEIEGNRVIAEGGSWGGLHTYMALVNFPDDFSAFISAVPVASVPYAFTKSHFGWLIPDDLFFKRDARGEYVDFPAQLRQVATWSALEQVPTMKKLKPLLTLSVRNDERAGPEQGPFMTRALEERFGPGAPVYLFQAPEGGHSMGSMLTEELLFVAKQAGVTELRPLGE